jgi:transcription elongation factor Elf1
LPGNEDFYLCRHSRIIFKKTREMKKVSLFFTSLAMVAFVACGSPAEEEETMEEKTEETVDAADETMDEAEEATEESMEDVEEAVDSTMDAAEETM